MTPAPHSSTKRPPAQRPRGFDGKGAWINFGGSAHRQSTAWVRSVAGLVWCRDRSVRHPPARVRSVSVRPGSFGVRGLGPLDGLFGCGWHSLASFGLGWLGFVRHPRAWVRSVSVRLGSFGIRAWVRLTVRSGAPGIRLARLAPARSGSLGSAFAGGCLACIHLGSFGLRSVAAIWASAHPAGARLVSVLVYATSRTGVRPLAGGDHRRVVILPAVPILPVNR
jgi:hypothetical protein